jgi:hypothetical protein
MKQFKTKIKKDFITLVNSAVASLDTSTKVSSYSARSLHGFMTKGAKEIINESFSKDFGQYNYKPIGAIYNPSLSQEFTFSFDQESSKKRKKGRPQKLANIDSAEVYKKYLEIRSDMSKVVKELKILRRENLKKQLLREKIPEISVKHQIPNRIYEQEINRIKPYTTYSLSMFLTMKYFGIEKTLLSNSITQAKKIQLLRIKR